MVVVVGGGGDGGGEGSAIISTIYVHSQKHIIPGTW